MLSNPGGKFFGNIESERWRGLERKFVILQYSVSIPFSAILVVTGINGEPWKYRTKWGFVLLGRITPLPNISVGEVACDMNRKKNSFEVLRRRWEHPGYLLNYLEFWMSIKHYNIEVKRADNSLAVFFRWKIQILSSCLLYFEITDVYKTWKFLMELFMEISCQSKFLNRIYSMLIYFKLCYRTERDWEIQFVDSI